MSLLFPFCPSQSPPPLFPEKHSTPQLQSRLHSERKRNCQRKRMTLTTLNPAYIIWNEEVINRRKRTYFTCSAFFVCFVCCFPTGQLMWGRKKILTSKSNRLCLPPFKLNLSMKKMYFSNRSCSRCALDWTATSLFILSSLTPEIRSDNRRVFTNMLALKENKRKDSSCVFSVLDIIASNFCNSFSQLVKSHALKSLPLLCIVGTY